MMRYKPLILTLTLIVALSVAPLVGAQKKNLTHNSNSAGSEQTISAAPNVFVSVCVISGDVIVRGWDRKEVHVRSSSAEKIELRRADSANASTPAQRIEVWMQDFISAEQSQASDCGTFSDIQLDVPRGATVEVKSRDGSLSFREVAEVQAETIGGDIEAQGVTKATEIASMSGNITLKDTTGRVKVTTVSGQIEVVNARSIDATDELTVKSVSGDLSLERIAYPMVRGGTISGSVSLMGPLVRGGQYGFTTHSGELTLNLPADSSFQINAKVAYEGEIVSDFAIKQDETSTKHKKNRLIGTYGSGDATIYLSSFSGVVSLRKK